MKDKWKWCLAGILGLFLVVGIPIIINECYKVGRGYITLWQANDVLAYYGSIVGGLVAVSSLIITISFTRKQILYERYLENEKEKWGKIDSIILDILFKINPIQMAELTMDNGMTDPQKAIFELQKYALICKTATDRLTPYLNIVDYPKVEMLVCKIQEFSTEFYDISQKRIAAYDDLKKLQMYDLAAKILENENRCPGTLSPEEIAKYSKMIEDTGDITLQQIELKLQESSNELVKSYENQYRSLLQFKGQTFEMINKDMQQNADRMLYFWRK